MQSELLGDVLYPEGSSPGLVDRDVSVTWFLDELLPDAQNDDIVLVTVCTSFKSTYARAKLVFITVKKPTKTVLF